MTLFDSIKQAAAQGKDIRVQPAPSGGRMEPDKVWASGVSKADAKNAFPPGTKLSKVDGRRVYYFNQNIDGGFFKFACMVVDNAEVHTYVLEPVSNSSIV